MTTTAKAQAQETRHNNKNRDTNGNDVKEIKTNDTEKVTGKKEQKISVSYTVKSFANNINKMVEAKMVTEEEQKQLKELHKSITQRWLNQGFGF